MSKLIFGDRVGKTAKLRVGASAIIFDTSRQRILLTRRSDNGRWCLPGGGMDAGESVSETCVREVREETGLNVRVTRLIGVYTTPDLIVEFPDGNRIQPVAASFEAEVVSGQLGLSDETIDHGYYTLAEMDTIDLMEHHKERIQDAMQFLKAAVVK